MELSGRCLDERKMRGMMIGGGERDRDGGGKRGLQELLHYYYIKIGVT